MENTELQPFLENTIKECNLVIEKWKSEQRKYKGYAVIPEKEVQGLFFTKTRLMMQTSTNRRTWNYRNKYKMKNLIHLYILFGKALKQNLITPSEFKRIKEYTKKEGNLDKWTYPSYNISVGMYFIWGRTPEGHAYWHEVSLKLCKIY